MGEGEWEILTGSYFADENEIGGVAMVGHWKMFAGPSGYLTFPSWMSNLGCLTVGGNECRYDTSKWSSCDIERNHVTSRTLHTLVRSNLERVSESLSDERICEFEDDPCTNDEFRSARAANSDAPALGDGVVDPPCGDPGTGGGGGGGTGNVVCWDELWFIEISYDGGLTWEIWWSEVVEVCAPAGSMSLTRPEGVQAPENTYSSVASSDARAGRVASNSAISLQFDDVRVAPGTVIFGRGPASHAFDRVRFHSSATTTDVARAMQFLREIDSANRASKSDLTGVRLTATVVGADPTARFADTDLEFARNVIAQLRRPLSDAILPASPDRVVNTRMPTRGRAGLVRRRP